jgi:LysM repeat protein
MRKNTKATFYQSDLARAKPKRHFLKTFVNGNLKQPRRLHSDTGLVMDRTSPTAVVRIIFGLIIVHLLVIGGVMMRGNIAKSNSGLAVAPTITPPPAETPAAMAPETQPAPVQPVAVATPDPAPQAQAVVQDTQVHITQEPVNMEAVTPVTAQPAAPVAVQPAPEPAAPAVPTVEIKHLIQSGDTWGRIAAQYNITEDVLKGANTQLAAMTNLPGGTYLSVPVPAGSTEARQAEAARPAVQDTAQYHVVKRGENLGRIAKKYKISLPKLLKLNNMTNADARRLQVGQKLKVSE